jgi:hypothetical protein
MSEVKDEWVMSDAEKKALVEQIGQHVIDRLVHASTDEKIVGQVVDTAAAQVQRVVGRAVIRGAIYIVAAIMMVGALKAGLLEWISTHIASK